MLAIVLGVLAALAVVLVVVALTMRSKEARASLAQRGIPQIDLEYGLVDDGFVKPGRFEVALALWDSLAVGGGIAKTNARTVLYGVLGGCFALGLVIAFVFGPFGFLFGIAPLGIVAFLLHKKARDREMKSLEQTKQFFRVVGKEVTSANTPVPTALKKHIPDVRKPLKESLEPYLNTVYDAQGTPKEGLYAVAAAPGCNEVLREVCYNLALTIENGTQINDQVKVLTKVADAKIKGRLLAQEKLSGPRTFSMMAIAACPIIWAGGSMLVPQVMKTTTGAFLTMGLFAVFAYSAYSLYQQLKKAGM